jgi:hypothetical protein
MNWMKPFAAEADLEARGTEPTGWGDNFSGRSEPNARSGPIVTINPD